MGQYIPLNDLEIYQLARKLSEKGWGIYNKLDWHLKKIIGDQFIQSIDSVGANIAEGYGRFHYLEKIKFCYNSRASLAESCHHWLELMFSRGIIEKNEYQDLKDIAQNLAVKLNNYIAGLYKAKSRELSR